MVSPIKTFFSLSGGDLLILPNTHQGFFIRMCFPHSGVGFETVHLLEHLLITHFLGSQKDLVGIQHHFGLNMNGVTLGTMLCIYNSIHKSKALECTEFMLNFLNKEHNFSKDMIEQEIDLIGIENATIPDIMKLTSQIDKYFDFSNFGDRETSIESVFSSYQKIISNNRPIVVLQGDCDDPQIVKSIELVRHTLSGKIKNNSAFSFLDIAYKPIIQQFPRSKEPQKIAVYMNGTLQEDKAIVFNTLLIQFVEEALLEFLRFGEKTEYVVERLPRATAYGRHMAWSFSSKYSYDDLLHLFEHVFFKKPEDFELLKEKIYYDALVRTDDDYKSFYYPTQSLILHGSFITMSEIANSLKQISFKEFEDYYYQCLKTMSMELVTH